MTSFRITFHPPKKKMSDLVLNIVAPNLADARRIARQTADTMGFRDYRLSNIKEKQ